MIRATRILALSIGLLTVCWVLASDTGLRLRQGEEALRSGDVVAAIKAFRGPRESSPEAWEPHDGLGRAWRAAGDLDAAQRELQRAVGIGIVVAVEVLAAQSQDGATGLPVPGSYRVDPETSWAGFRLKATMHTVHGRDGALAGTFRVAEAEGSGWELSGEVTSDPSTLQTGNDRRDRKMWEDILEVAGFPSLRFRPRAASLHPDDVPEGGERMLQLSGELEIRGRTQPLELPVTARFDGGRLTLDGSFTVAFEDFDIPDPSVFLLRVQKQVLATVHLEALREGD